MIYVHGYFGYNNCGDEAFKCVFKKYLKGFEFKFTSPKNPPPENPSGKDVIILGGGNVIGEYFLESLKNWKNRIYAVGVGLSSSEGLDILAKLEPVVCLVRNKDEIGVIKNKISCAEFIPDIVLSLTSNELLESTVGSDLPGYEDIIVKKNSLQKTAVIVLSDRIISYLSVNEDFISSLDSLSGLLRFVDFLKFLGEYYNLHFLAFSNDFYHPDHALNTLIASTLSGYHDRISFSVAGSQPFKAFSILNGADVVFSMKFHSMIFSLISNTPIVNLSDAPKCLSLINEFELNSFSKPVGQGATSDDLKNILKAIEGGLFNISSKISTVRNLADEIMWDLTDRVRKDIS